MSAYRPRIRTMLVRERGPAKPAPQINTASDVVAAMHGLERMDREHFVCLYLDATHRMIGSPETVSIGHLTAALVHPREVFKGALQANAAAIAMAHNHPSGSPEPSREDFEITRRLVKAGEILGIPVLDHVVIATGGHVSIAERGW